jgi:hypothetical protein
MRGLPLRPWFLVLVALLLALPITNAGVLDDRGPVLVPNQGPYVRPVTEPVASVVVFEAEHWAWTEAIRTRTVALRVILRFHSWPNGANGDPWDRLFAVHVEGVEVMRGVTTRGDFTVRDDITEYAVLLSGATARIGVHLSSWANDGLFTTVELLFYHEPTSLVGDQPASTIVAAYTHAGMGGERVTTVTFPAAAPGSATIELFTTGHTQDGEFWYLNALSDPTPPRFKVFIDGTHVGTVHAMPYIYPFIGFCCSSVSWLLNQHLWWSAHQVLSEAGVYTGSGIIPSYRAELPADLLPLLSGERTVMLVKENHRGYWPTSVTFLMDD